MGIKSDSYTNQAGSGPAPFPQGTDVTGFTDGSAIAAGKVGEIIESAQINLAGVTSTPVNYASLSLTAGYWLLTGCVNFSGAAGGGDLLLSWSDISATHANTLSGDPYYFIEVVGGYDGTSGSGGSNLPTLVINISSSTTVYAVISKGGGSAAARGFARALRIG